METLAWKSAWTLQESRSGSWMLGLASSQFESSMGLKLRVSSSPYGGPFGRDLWKELCRAPFWEGPMGELYGGPRMGGLYGRTLLEVPSGVPYGGS